MFNLIKMDFYRLFRTRSFYVVGSILIALILIFMYSLGNIEPEILQGEFNLDIHNLQSVSLLHSLLTNNLIPLVIGIGAAMFICTDYSSGYIKNIASSVKMKYTLALSKLIVYTVAIILYITLMVVLTYIFANMFIANVVIGDMGILIQYLGLYLFLSIVYLAMIELAASVFRSSAATITLLVVVMMASQIGYTAIDHFIGIDLAPYSPMMNLQTITPADTSGWMKALMVAAMCFVLYITGSMVVLEKKDIT